MLLPWSTVYQRFRDWRDDDTFEQILERLHVRLNQEGLIDLDTWMIDSTVVRATRASSGTGKKGPKEPLDHALGRSRGGLTTKIHLVYDANGAPLRFMLSPGQTSDIAQAQPLLKQVRIPGKPGWPRKRCRWLLADKGYDTEHLRQYRDRYRMQPVTPQRTMKRKPKPGLPRLFDRPKYRQRNIIERMFGWLKESRRVGTRYDKLARSFTAMVTLACTLRCLRQYFSYSSIGNTYRPHPNTRELALYYCYSQQPVAPYLTFAQRPFRTGLGATRKPMQLPQGSRSWQISSPPPMSSGPR